MDEGVRQKVERLKGKAELFLNNNIPVFIKDVNDNYYFCKIIIIGANPFCLTTQYLTTEY